MSETNGNTVTLVACPYCDTYIYSHQHVVCPDCEDRLTRDIAIQEALQHIEELYLVGEKNLELLKERRGQIKMIYSRLREVYSQLEEETDGNSE